MKDIDSNFNVIKGKDIIKDGSLGSIDIIEEEFDDQEIEFINNDIDVVNKFGLQEIKESLDEEIKKIYDDILSKAEKRLEDEKKKKINGQFSNKDYRYASKPFLNKKSDKLTELYAEYFAILDIEDEITNKAEENDDYAGIDRYFNESYEKVETIKNKYLAYPFFINYVNNLSPIDVTGIGLSLIKKEYQANEDWVLSLSAPENYQRQFLGRGLSSGFIDVDGVITRCNYIIARVNDTRIGSSGFSRKQAVDAVDLIIAHTLKSKAAKSSFFDKVCDKESDIINIENLNKQIIIMRHEIMLSPHFRSLLDNKVPMNKFYNEYRRLVNEEIDGNIKKQKQTEKLIETDTGYKDFMRTHLSNTEYMVSIERFEDIEIIYNDIKRINEGKKPSEYMKKMMRACEKFIKEYKEHDGFVKGSVIYNLNKTSVKYYDKRKGIISGPVTGKGQARLNNVEKLLKYTSAMMDTVKKDADKAFKAHNTLKATQKKVKTGVEYKK